MPKSQKQKKAKAADFVKAKLKVGKGKQLANNTTSTSFSAKAIALPNQRIRIENTAIPTTKANLTLDDLIVRLRHYSPNTRKEALTGLRELLGSYPIIWRLNLGTIIHSCASLISDENPAVRKSLRAFFAWFLPSLNGSLLKPFYSVIIFFASSALSHIFPEIRVDAIHIIDILLDVAPDCVVSGCSLFEQSTCEPGNLPTQTSDFHQQPGVRLLRLYLSLLSIDSDSAAPGLSSTPTNQLSASSKVIVWKSLARFISVATSLDSHHNGKLSMPLWIFRRAFVKERDFEAFRVLLTDPDSSSHNKTLDANYMVNTENFNDLTCHMFEPFTEAFVESNLFQQSFTNTGDFSLHSSDEPSDLIPGNDANANDYFTSWNLLRAMHPAILSIFLDTAPTAFQLDLNPTARAISISSSGTQISSNIELIYSAITVLHRLWQAGVATDSLITANNLKSLETILTKMAPYFVFGGDDIAPHGPELNHLLQNLNLMYCDLVSLLVLVKPNCGNTLAVQLNRVGEYLTDLLSEKASNINSKSGTLHTEAYRGIFPIVWSLFRHDSMQRGKSDGNRVSWASNVLEAFINHLNSLAPGSELKSLGINFLARLCIMDDLPGCQFNCELDMLSSETQEILRNWMLGLPKILWQLGNKNPSTSHLVLSFLHRILSRPMPFFQPSLEKLPRLLGPFFSTNHPNTGRIILGPYGRLPISCKKLAQGVAWYLVNDSTLAQDILQAFKSSLKECDILFC